MKVFELITELLKYPAGYEVKVEIVNTEYLKDGSTLVTGYSSVIDDFISDTTSEELSLLGTTVT